MNILVKATAIKISHRGFYSNKELTFDPFFYPFCILIEVLSEIFGGYV